MVNIGNHDFNRFQAIEIIYVKPERMIVASAISERYKSFPEATLCKHITVAKTLYLLRRAFIATLYLSNQL